MAALLDGIPLGDMNTSMTINATAMWLLALYIATAEENGVDQAVLQGTTQNDILKEYLSRGTYAFPPGPSMRLIADMVAYTVNHVPKWNPINICSYHLQEAGATPVQEIAYAMSNAIAVLDAVRERGRRRSSCRRSSAASPSSSTPASASSRSTRSCARWASCGKSSPERYGVEDEKLRRFRYGVQVNSLGLTEAQPENNIQRIVLEALAVTIGRDARARAMQLPAWNEALGLPRPWDQQWALRIQQVLAFETDLLEYPDIFEGSIVMDGLVAELVDGAKAEMAVVEEHGGAVEAVPYMKAALVDSHSKRVQRIEEGDLTVVGINSFTDDRGVAADRRRRGRHHGRRPRDRGRADRRPSGLARRSATRAPSRPRWPSLPGWPRDRAREHHAATIAAATAGATTGEWAQTLRDVFGSYRGPTGIGDAVAAGDNERLEELRDAVDRVSDDARPPPEDPRRQARPRRALQRRRADRGARPRRRDGRRLRGHPPDAVADRRLGGPGGRPRGRPLDPLGLAPRVDSRCDRAQLRDAGVDVPVVFGGIIPDHDVPPLHDAGVAAVYTPKDFDLNRIMRDIVELVAERNGVAASA